MKLEDVKFDQLTISKFFHAENISSSVAGTQFSTTLKLFAAARM